MRISPASSAVVTQVTAAQNRAALAGPFERLAKAPSADSAFDGALVGANGVTVPASTPLEKVPAFVPQQGEPRETVVYVNGVWENVATQAAHAQMIANAMNVRVVGLHNATDGGVQDLLQAVADIFRLGDNRASDSLASLIVDHLSRRQPLHLVAHSQGALVTARAIEQAKKTLEAKGLSADEAQARLGLLTVETLGGAEHNYPDGPRYVHYLNRNDLVPDALGVGDPIPGNAHLGAGAQLRTFSTGFISSAHDVATYLAHWKPL